MKHNLKFFLIAILLIAGVLVLAKYKGQKYSTNESTNTKLMMEQKVEGKVEAIGSGSEEWSKIEVEMNSLLDDDFAGEDAEVGI